MSHLLEQAECWHSKVALYICFGDALVI